MSDSRSGEGTTIVLLLALLLVLGLFGGAFWLWQRQRLLVQQQVAVAQEHQLVAEAARLESRALQESTAARGRASRFSSGVPLTSDSDATDMQTADIEAQVTQVLTAQLRAWNAGDIDQFMESYWNSEQLTFSSGGKLTRSWQDTLLRYHQRYPSAAHMGQLDFDNIEVHPLGASAAYVLGEWQLDRDSETIGGNFTLIMRKFDERWLIVHDHTSQREPPE